MASRTDIAGERPARVGPKERRTLAEAAIDEVLRGLPDRPLQFVSGRSGDSFVEIMRRDSRRVAFHLEKIQELVPPGGKIVDIGGGIGLFAPAAAKLGFHVVLVDDFSDRWHGQASDILDRQGAAGVEILSLNILDEPLPFADDSIDLVTSFDCLEHLPKSPRPMLRQSMRALRDGGHLMIGLPNCVNLRKRITVPFGYGKWSALSEWYDDPVFRGHIREPDVDDLKAIGADLGMKDVTIIGRNWLGYDSRFPLVRMLVPVADGMLRLFPSLCSNLYLIGRK